ncbi:MAG: 6-phosphogluconolactonase [Alphaproteobacteria bacterium]|nr:6-phosphogluconolactonase [Alphaproteobacteria bacterium]
MNIQHFDTPLTWAQATADFVGKILCADISRRGHSVLAMCGGSTARKILPVLAQTDVEWDKLVCTLVDERWVPPIHEDSNERLIREHLPAQCRFTGLYTGDASPSRGLSMVEERIRPLIPFGCVLLGMGDDGHIASLFPGQTLQNRILQTAERPDHPRISMTLRTLLSASAVVLAVSGTEKCAVLEHAMNLGAAGELPVGRLLHQDIISVNVFSS